MTNSRQFRVQLLIRLYVVLSLSAAAVLSPLTFSSIPLLLLALFLYFGFKAPRPKVAFSLHLFLFLAMPLMFESIVGLESSPMVSLPLLGLLDYDLQRMASVHHFQDSRFKRQPNRLLLNLALVIGISLAISASLGKVNLLIVCALLAGYLLFLIARIFAATPPLPIEASKAQYRVIAGHEMSFTVSLLSRFKLAGWINLTSPYEWVKLRTYKLSLSQGSAELNVTLTPPLAGPSSICSTYFVLDRWGLIQQKFELELAELLVIPRARYAAWLARRYLETTRVGVITPMASTMGAFRASAGCRRGIEYYGTKLYEPGDSLRNIDWKHSMKLDELVVKEFDNTQASSAAILLNLTVGNQDEADQLVYAWLITSITLAQEGIPTMLAVYNHDDVLEVTELLDPRQLVLRSLALSWEIVTRDRPQRYLQPPDPVRLRADINRLKAVGLPSVAKLTELLDIEFRALRDCASFNPATRALNRVLGKTGSCPTVLFISAGNHDEEALLMAKLRLNACKHHFAEIPLKGNATMARKQLSIA